MSNKYIMIDIADFPSEKAIKDSVERLRKDIGILTKYPKMKVDVDPASLKRVCDFLDMIYAREGKRLKKSRKGDKKDESLDINNTN